MVAGLRRLPWGKRTPGKAGRKGLGSAPYKGRDAHGGVIRCRAALRCAAGDGKRPGAKKDSGAPTSPRQSRTPSRAVGRLQKDDRLVVHRVKEKKRPTREELRQKETSKKLDADILALALPAFVALACDPIASIVDSIWIGKIGAVELAGTGIAIAILNIVVRLFNTPLLSVTTSVIAKAYADPNEDIGKGASVAIELGIVSGIVQTLILYSTAPLTVHLMGVDHSDPVLWNAAVTFLKVRALGAPANVLLLATQGVFRGIADTKRPLYATLGGNALNILLDPLFILGFGTGVEGAAWATVISEYCAAFYLLWTLHRKIGTLKIQFNPETWKQLKGLAGPSATLVFRSFSIVSTYGVAASLSLNSGEELAAAHQVCHQLWLGCTLLADSLAVAAQTLIAQNIVKNDPEKIRQVTFKTCSFGLAVGTVAALLMQLSHTILPTVFTTDSDTLAGIGHLLPFVIWTQPITALAFVLDGVLYGGGDFQFATLAMFLSATPSMFVMCTSLLANDPYDKLSLIWVGYSLLMAMRIFMILYRVQSQSGPYRKYFLPEPVKVHKDHKQY